MEEHVRKNDIEIENVKNSVLVLKGEINGKLDKIHSILERQNETMDVFIKGTNAQLEVIMPYIKGFEGSKSVAKFFMWFGGVIITLGGAYQIVKGIFIIK